MTSIALSGPATKTETKPATKTEAKRKARKRGDGEGSISKHATGVWRARVMVDGRRREVYAKSRGEVQQKLDDLRQRARGGLLGDPKVERDTVGAYLSRWLEGKQGTIEADAWRRHKDNVTLHLIPTLGKVKLAALRPEHLRRLYAAKLTQPRGPVVNANGRKIGRANADQPLSARTVRYIHVTVHQALAQAVKDGDLARNIAEAVTPPKLDRREMRALAPEEVTRFMARAAQHRLAALWTLALHTGCREGELLALKWSDITWNDGSGRATVTVQRNLT